MYQTVNQLSETYQLSKATIRRIAHEMESDAKGRYKVYDILKVGNRIRIDDRAFRYALRHRKAIRKNQDPRGL